MGVTMDRPPFDDVLERALELPLAEQARLMERLAAAIRDEFTEREPATDVPLWTDDELAEMTQIEPMTGAEIIAAGLTGGWSDMGIEDSGEWVNAQKQKRKEKRRW